LYSVRPRHDELGRGWRCHIRVANVGIVWLLKKIMLITIPFHKGADCLAYCLPSPDLTVAVLSLSVAVKAMQRFFYDT
jgi:hypothetical protein